MSIVYSLFNLPYAMQEYFSTNDTAIGGLNQRSCIYSKGQPLTRKWHRESQILAKHKIWCNRQFLVAFSACPRHKFNRLKEVSNLNEQLRENSGHASNYSTKSVVQMVKYNTCWILIIALIQFKKGLKRNNIIYIV